MANTTVFKETDVEEVEELCKLLTDLGVDGMLVSPGYHYESVERDIFLTQVGDPEEVPRVLEISKKYRLTSTPMFLEFAAGLRDYKCSPWSTVTYTPNGWKGPCYLIGKTWSPTSRSSGTARTGRTGSRARTRSARTARCTRASRRRS